VVEHDPACEHCAAKIEWIKNQKRPEAKLQQDGAALARMLGVPDWQGAVHAETDPEAWFINDLFERYGAVIRREIQHAFEGYDAEDWLMDRIIKIWANQPYGLVPYAEDGRAYGEPRGPRSTKTSRHFVSLARSWVRQQTHLSADTREGYLDIIDRNLARQTGKRTLREVDEELVQSLLDGAPESERLAVGEIIVGAAHELVRLNAWVEQPGNIGGWLTTVLRNAFRNAVRDQERHRETLAGAILQPNHWTHVKNHGESAEATFMRRESECEILARIKRLPRHLSQVAYLRYWGFPNAEIAWLLNIHIKTVEYRLRKIRSPRIRQALGL